MARFSLRPALLPFGTLLTGSTIGTNNEKSTKVWTGDAENTPVELVAYNSDGTLPTNQVYYGSYVGDGTRGLSARKPMSITFPFEPKLLWVIGSRNTTNISLLDLIDYDGSPTGIVVLSELTNTYTQGVGIPSARIGNDRVLPSYTYAKMSSDRKTYTWYYSEKINMYYILNTSGTTYYYVAIG